MANRNQQSQYPILSASFNQDASLFAVGTRSGFKLFDAETGRLHIGGFSVVEMRFSSSLIAIVGAGEQPSLSPRRLCLFNTTSGTALQELNFLTSILAVRLNKLRLVVILQDQTFIYDLNSLAILRTIDTVPNPRGVCAFSHHLDGSFLALPASTTKGSALVYNVMKLHSHCEIHAHQSPLAAMALSSGGAYLATASEQGTKIRVHLVLDGTKCCSFRRGTYPSTIFSLSFGPSIQLPDLLGATSSSGSLHVFLLGSAVCERSRRSNTIIGSMIPGSITDVLDPSDHHVLHNVVPEGVKSYAVIRQMDKVANPSASSTISFRATIYIISYDGYFREYSLTMNDQKEPTWNLKHEFTLANSNS
ncbi:Autophagy-related protein [Drosera capensis]